MFSSVKWGYGNSYLLGSVWGANKTILRLTSPPPLYYYVVNNVDLIPLPVLELLSRTLSCGTWYVTESL